MEEIIEQDSIGLFSRIGSFFRRDQELAPDRMSQDTAIQPMEPRLRATYTVTVRKGITTFDDAMAAAQGMKRGEQQIINLSGAESTLRQKIVDFISGVNFAQDGTWEEIGEDIYLVVPSHAYVEVAPATPRMTSLRN